MTEAHANVSFKGEETGRFQSLVPNLSNTPKSKSGNLATITPESAAQFSAEAQKITPQIVFKKKTWRHRLQELNFKKQIRAMIARSRPLFVLETLKDDDKVWFTSTEDVVKDGVLMLVPKIYFKRCQICWEPATLVERCVEDSTYRRWLCDQHRDK